jgi:nucleotide-binding universal stress UspA family protein
MRTIIALTDFSNSATNALNYAANLAQKFNCRLLVYHSSSDFDLAAEIPVKGKYFNELLYEDRLKVEQETRRIKKVYNVHVDALVDDLSIHERLPALVQKEQADLVVIGMWGIGAFERKVFGSSAITIMENANFPVLVVPDGALYHAPKSILLACNYTYIKGNNNLTILREMAAFYKSKISVVYVNKFTDNSARNTNLEHLFKDIEHDYELIPTQEVVEAIADKIRDEVPDMLAIVPRENRFWDFMIDKNLSQNLASHANIPLLTLPNPVS